MYFFFQMFQSAACHLCMFAALFSKGGRFSHFIEFYSEAVGFVSVLMLLSALLVKHCERYQKVN